MLTPSMNTWKSLSIAIPIVNPEVHHAGKVNVLRSNISVYGEPDGTFAQVVPTVGASEAHELPTFELANAALPVCQPFAAVA